MSIPSKHVFGKILAILGTAIVSAEAITYYYFIYVRREHYDVSMWLLLIGAIFGFYGYYVQYPKEAKDSTDFVVSRVERIIRGRRQEDQGREVTIAQKTTVIQKKEEPDV